MVLMNKYLVQITEYHGEFIDADKFERDYVGNTVSFILNTPVGGTNPPRTVAVYSMERIYGFREVTYNKE